MSKLTTNSAIPDNTGWSPDSHARLLRHSELQFHLPAFEAPKPPAWLEPLLEFLKPLGPYIAWGFGIIAAVLVCSLLYIFARRAMMLWKDRLPRKAKPAAAEPWRPAPEVARRLLHDADSLAARGDFAEAAHLLLLRSIDDIEERRPMSVRPALTSREIGVLDALPAAARPSFADIARIVEKSLFGGSPVDAADYARCRSAYERFAFPESWSKAA